MIILYDHLIQSFRPSSLFLSYHIITMGVLDIVPVCPPLYFILSSLTVQQRLESLPATTFANSSSMPKRTRYVHLLLLVMQMLTMLLVRYPREFLAVVLQAL